MADLRMADLRMEDWKMEGGKVRRLKGYVLPLFR
jgi:hypothetical protein